MSGVASSTAVQTVASVRHRIMRPPTNVCQAGLALHRRLLFTLLVWLPTCNAEPYTPLKYVGCLAPSAPRADNRLGVGFYMDWDRYKLLGTNHNCAPLLHLNCSKQCTVPLINIKPHGSNICGENSHELSRIVTSFARRDWPRPGQVVHYLPRLR
jgi:hypothetical protein